MKTTTIVLIVCSGNSNSISPFIVEQVEALNKFVVQTDYFLIKGKGVLGYLNNLRSLFEKIKKINPDLIHAHYGFSGLLAGLQRKVPVIITLHGSDVNYITNRFYSKLASKLVVHTILVSRNMAEKIKIKKNYSIIPCGISFDDSLPIGQQEAKNIMNMHSDKKYILFSSSFNRQEKNVDLAWKALNLMPDEIELIELKGYNRKEVTMLLNAVDLVLMTSISEGSPQFIKEAMACNCPVVSTNVGDVRWVIGNTEGCYITSYKPEDVAESIRKALRFGKRTTGRERIKQLYLDSESVAKKIIAVYNKVLNC